MPAGKPGVYLVVVAGEGGLQVLHADVEDGVSVHHVSLVLAHLHTTRLAAVVGSGRKGVGLGWEGREEGGGGVRNDGKEVGRGRGGVRYNGEEVGRGGVE